jgi:hypothetical protein
MSQLGIWRSIPDRPEHFHHRAVTDAVSDVSIDIIFTQKFTFSRDLLTLSWYEN